MAALGEAKNGEKATHSAHPLAHAHTATQFNLLPPKQEAWLVKSQEGVPEPSGSQTVQEVESEAHLLTY